MSKRQHVDPPNAARCRQTITLRDGSKARCGRRFASKGPWCTQHRHMLEELGLVKAPIPVDVVLHKGGTMVVTGFPAGLRPGEHNITFRSVTIAKPAKRARKAHTRLCPVCGEVITVTGYARDGRAVGSCGDAFVAGTS